ncbi:nicotinate-nucleotide adenylyltransferase [Desulfatitalea alkaliphila]|uniref:Probable nicotinate-nucleotide adenylyltransferase n=1 Tax=Desulfatitalea alkaliphila TaxID=2929485 RepID=A0AA41R2K7_9BACT|nr:nicotinate-nucleotide adenylyltransferase [Desulfatitalea alkaliphila]MCJ8500934.1 nicotinate-nucleotide adenylyltransferase [Desulfatitalea alkaliphila]
MTNLDQSRRVGLFGGTFNPIHRGHLQAAGDVLRRADLERIYFVPSAQPPHKSNGKLAPADDRLAMVRMALADHPRMRVCEAELRRTGPSYSIDTIRAFKAALPEGGRLYFVVGIDAFLEIDTWKACDHLFEETAFIVMSRPGTGDWTPALCRQIEGYVQSHIATDYALADDGKRLVHPAKQSITLVSVTPVDISSSRIRTMIRQGKAIDQWVPPAVADHIQTRGLYR